MTVFNMFTNSIDRKINEIGAEGEAVDLDIEFNQDLKVITMRPNQKHVYENYLYEQYFNMIEPMGAGKSMTLKYLCTKLLEDNKKLKVIIIVPRTLISNTFKKETLEYPDGIIRKWDIGKNLCDDHQDKIKTLISFLKKTKFPKGIRNRVCVTTHIAFSMLQDRLGDIDNAFDNTLVIIDEAHHVLSPDYDVVETSNRIGRVVGQILKRNHKSTSLWLVSATLFRNDRGNIVPQNMIDMFTEHFLPFDQHWKENIKYIKTFEYNFVIYNDIFKDIQAIIEKNKKKTIIFCPYNGHLLRNSNKFKFRDKLDRYIKKVWADYEMLDLIDPNDRETRKKLLEIAHRAKNIDIIYSLKLFDEGTDWKYAAQAIDAAPRDSLSIQIQKLGRILRDLIGKDHVAYYIFFPQQSVFKDDEERVNHLKKMFAILAGALILREAIQPLPYPQLPEPRDVNPFEEAVPSPTIRKDIIQKISEELLCFAESNPDPTPTETREKIKEILKDEFNIEDDENYSITTHIGMMFKRLEQSQSINEPPLINKPQPNWKPSIDLGWMPEAGYDKIFEKSIYHTLLMFGTEAAGVETFDEFRRIYGKSYQEILNEKISLIKELIKKHGEKATSCKWLLDNYPSLYAYMRNHKDIFNNLGIGINIKDIPRKDYKKILENLAKQNGGTIPQRPYFTANDIIDVYYHYQHNKNKYTHLTFKGEGKRKKETFKKAKDLIKSNNGVLQPCIWLEQNGHRDVYRFVNKNPDLCKGWKQFYGQKGEIRIIGTDKKISMKDIEYPKICRALIDKFGAIPTGTALKNELQLHAVYRHMKENPKLYQGMKQWYTIGRSKPIIRIIGE